MPPRVSVITPLFNGAKWIEAALDSLRQQTLSHFEALVVDDGSTDGGPAIVKRFCAADPRFHFIQKSHGGIPHTRNFGLREAQGDFITFLDQDDLYRPEKIEEETRVLDNTPNAGAVYCAIERIDEQSRSLGLRAPYLLQGSAFVTLMRRSYAMSLLTVMVRRESAQRAGPLDESLFGLDDYDWLLRVAAENTFAYINRPLVLQRFRPGTSGQSERMFQDRFPLAEKMRRQWPAMRRLADRFEQHSHYFYGSHLLDCNRPGDARVHFAKALRLKPWDIKAAIKWVLSWR